MGNKDIELQEDSPTAVSDKPKQEERPPTPPKRDFQAEEKSQVDGKRKKIGSFPRPEVIYKPESTATCMTCLKNLFIFFNLIIWLFGAVLTGIGVWIKVDKDFWDIQTGLDMKQFTSAGYVLIVAGVFIMLVGFLGCYGAFTESVCLLIVFSIVVILIILLEIAVAALVWSASNNKDLKEKIKSKAKNALQYMNDDDSLRYFLDLLHTKLHCCGIDGPNDFQQYEKIPQSCTDTSSGFPYKEGCSDAVVQYLKSKAAILGGIAIGVFVLQLTAIIIAVVLIIGLRQAVTNSIF